MIKPIFALGLILFSIASLTYGEVVRFPNAGDIYDKHHSYPLKLLKLALTNTEYELRPSSTFMNQGRALKQLAGNQDIEVMWTMTSSDREKQALPIRIPIYKGLIGWRLFIINKENIGLKRDLSEDRLRKLVTIQGHDWPDTKILRANQFNVLTGPDYLGLFKLVTLGRADLFPRSVIEVWDEIESLKSNDKLEIEKTIALRYPTASYYFVSKDNRALSNAIETGLLRTIENGKFDALFESYFGSAISLAELDTRKHILLDNPFLPKETPLHRSELWYH